MIRRPPRSTQSRSSAASDVYKRQGDDWNDVPVMRKVAFSAAPADAQPGIIHLADWVSEFKGGHGAARDLINYVLIHKCIYEKTILSYLDSIG